MPIGAVAAPTGTQSSAPKASNRVFEMGSDVFLKLLLAELRNQDPLSPMDNHQLLQQIAQLRAVESNLQLTKTLEAVMRGQSLQAATALLGREVEGLSEEGKTVAGRVERIALEDSKVKLVVADQTIALDNLRTIGPRSEGGWLNSLW
ncbi:MAG: hypothetical protein NZ899_00925 [Thermoguttaceae bacterium]|nr:hypothetical protein [Thermoguttaceae bacterium]MDW8077457.1 flagellar hook capping FlgD N-terminal domain-containing protein [Thermoguttaceae bacterium]